MSTPVRLGLTGGIGSGKSTVAGLLARQGAGVVDADAISRQLTAAGGLAISSIATAFGLDFITTAGALNRDRMRSLIHTDSGARQRLEAIVHPLVGQETRRQASLLAEQGKPCIVFDVPLLVESALWRHNVDHVMVVDCTPEVQIQRVMTRNQLQRQEIEKIILSQASRERRLSAADSVLFNVGLSVEALTSELLQVLNRFGLSSA